VQNVVDLWQYCAVLIGPRAASCYKRVSILIRGEKMKKLLLACAAVAGMAGAVDAAVLPFTFSNNGGTGLGTDNGASPVYDFSLTLSSNANNVGGINTTYTATAPEGVKVDFNWAYFTIDVDGSAFDPFGYFVGGTFTTLTANLAAPAIQGAASSFIVAAGQDFGFWSGSVDADLGRSTGTVFGTITPVPLPAGGILLVGALGGLMALRRRKEAALAA
jgi:hypothetical protein